MTIDTEEQRVAAWRDALCKAELERDKLKDENLLLKQKITKLSIELESLGLLHAKVDRLLKRSATS